jgi:Kae1-associated kinase Bud32
MNSEIVKEKIIHKGAEANLYYGKWFGKEVIFKYRVPKLYRIEILDKNIRTSRTLSEARALIRVKNYGVNVPQVFEIDPINATIVMKYIKGEKLKDVLGNLEASKKERYFEIIGKYTAMIHKNGIIHGDITTSNLIITPNGEIFFIDFGLHENSDNIEDKSVDLHLLKRVLISSHGNDYDLCFKSFLKGYQKEYGEMGIQQCTAIIKNIDAIETRGRYVKKEERL